MDWITDIKGLKRRVEALEVKIESHEITIRYLLRRSADLERRIAAIEAELNISSSHPGVTIENCEFSDAAPAQPGWWGSDEHCEAIGYGSCRNIMPWNELNGIAQKLWLAFADAIIQSHFGDRAKFRDTVRREALEEAEQEILRCVRGISVRAVSASFPPTDVNAM